MTGGVVFRVHSALLFLPATVARKVLPMPNVARVPGAPAELVGIALVEGEMIPVVAIGEFERLAHAASRSMLLCVHLGERVGLVGLDIVSSGNFDDSGAFDVVHEGVSARLFDIAAVMNRLRESRRAV